MTLPAAAEGLACRRRRSSLPPQKVFPAAAEGLACRRRRSSGAGARAHEWTGACNTCLPTHPQTFTNQFLGGYLSINPIEIVPSWVAGEAADARN